jgi:phosphoglycerate kinase
MMGGIKISDKVETIVNLGAKADKILLSGGIANLFFHVKGLEVGKSKIEPEGAKVARELSRNFKDRIVLPYDVVVANEKMDTSTIRVCQPFEVRKNEIILDAGPKTILAFAEEIKKAKTILWNGPLGYFEKKPFDTATMALAHLIGGRGKGKAFVVAGGGETVDAIRLAQQFKHIDHVSTGGGAMLEFLAGKKLPGIEALK